MFQAVVGDGGYEEPQGGELRENVQMERWAKLGSRNWGAGGVPCAGGEDIFVRLLFRTSEANAHRYFTVHCVYIPS